MGVWGWRKEVEGMRKKRETGYKGYLYRITLPVALCFPCCATQSPHREVEITTHTCDPVHCCTETGGWDLYCTDLMTQYPQIAHAE